MPATSQPAIRGGTPADVETVVEWWTNYFGGDPEEFQVVTDGCDPADDHWAFVRVAVADGTLVGAAVGAVYIAEVMEDVIPYESLFEYYSAQNGYINFVAVHPSYRRQGLGTRLVEAVEHTIAETTADRVFALSWQREAPLPDSTGIFEGLGYTELAHVDAYYAEFDTRDYCPDCGEGTCHCAAKVFGKDL